MRRLLLPPLVLLVAVAAGCSDGDEPVASGPGDVPTGTYLSVAVTEAGQDRPLVDGTRISLTFDDGTIGASLGCNSMGGDASVRDGVLVLDGGLATTEMGCEPALMDQDAWFGALLGSSPTVAVAGDELTLTSGGTVVVLRERSVVDPDRPLVGTEWTVDGFLDGDAAMSMAPPAAPASLRFDAETSMLTGSDGCNELTVPFEIDGDRLDFGDLVTTDVACPGNEEYAERVAAALTGTVTYTIESRSLTLLAQDGRGATLRAD